MNRVRNGISTTFETFECGAWEWRHDDAISFFLVSRARFTKCKFKTANVIVKLTNDVKMFKALQWNHKGNRGRVHAGYETIPLWY